MGVEGDGEGEGEGEREGEGEGEGEGKGQLGGEGGHLCARARFDLGFDLGLISVLTSVLRTPLANRIATQHDRAPSRGARNSRPGHLGFCCLHLGFSSFGEHRLKNQLGFSSYRFSRFYAKCPPCVCRQ